MRRRIIAWLLKLLGSPVTHLPEFPIYAIVISQARLADVTININRARALAREADANGLETQIWRFGAIAPEPFRSTPSSSRKRGLRTPEPFK